MASRLPAFLNPAAGSASEAERVLGDTLEFDLRLVSPEQLATAIRAAVAEGATRVVIAGGDGSIGSAAAVLAGTPVELAVIPIGTLNHFAKDHGIPEDPRDAADLALRGSARAVDVGMVNGRVFLNTSSVGTYVFFVRLRDRLERRVGYHLASLVAALRLLWRLPTFRVELAVAGERRHYITPLVFIGVGERDLRLPRMGARDPDGDRSLHLIVVAGKTRARILVLAMAIAAAGLPRRAFDRYVAHVLTDHCRIDLPRRRATVALDGELVILEPPLDYRIACAALRVVVPSPESATR